MRQVKKTRKCTICYSAYLRLSSQDKILSYWSMPRTELKEIAFFVRETRQRLGLTQEQFALKLGVSYQSVNRWENGRTKPQPLAMQQIKQQLRLMGVGGQDLVSRYLAD